MDAPPHRPAERTVATVWPSISAGPLGQKLGRWYGIRAGLWIGPIPMTFGWGLALLTAPLAALLYLGRKAPRKPLVLLGPINSDCVRYRITTARVLVEHPLEKETAPLHAIALEDFDAATIEVCPGQEWFDAGDIVLQFKGTERLRLRGTPRPEPFVRTLLKTQQAAQITAPANPQPVGAT